MLIDFQVTRIGSPALDLNTFAFCSYGSSDIHGDCDHIKIYYEIFEGVFQGSGVPVPFQYDELLEECTRKKMFGFKMAMDSLHRIQAASPHGLAEYSSMPLATIITEENDNIMRKDYDDSRLRMMYTETFTKTVLENPDEFIDSLHVTC